MKQDDITIAHLNQATLLVGSMISADERTSLPNGMLVANQIISLLLGGTFASPPKHLEITQSIINQIEFVTRSTPFEALFQHYPDQRLARNLLAKLYSSGQPNPFHQAISAAVSKGHIAHLITTNYDPHLEDSIDTATVVTSEVEAIAAAPAKSNVVFKIHGCARKPDTMIYRISDEGSLPAWKRELMKELVEGRDLAVIGYSGSDFDICPILFLLPYKRLFWLFRDTAPIEIQIQHSTENVKHAHASSLDFTKVYGTTGGFDAFFGPLLPLGTAPFRLSNKATTIGSDLFAGEITNKAGFAIWRAALFNSISCRVGTLCALHLLDPADRGHPLALKLAGDADERGGLYRDSIRKVRSWRASLDQSRDTDDWLDTLFVEAGRLYTAGFPIKLFLARRRLHSSIGDCENLALPFDNELAVAKSTYLSLLTLKSFQEIPVVGSYLTRILSRKIDRPAVDAAAQTFYERGLWQELRLVQIAASDLRHNVSIRSGQKGDADLLLRAASGFSHLNNLVGRSSAYRKEGRFDSDVCNKILEDLAAFGHHAELWKAYRSFRKVLSNQHFETYGRLATLSLWRCQYSRPLKAIFLFYFCFGTLSAWFKRRLKRP